jgi:hypothetical protein
MFDDVREFFDGIRELGFVARGREICSTFGHCFYHIRGVGVQIVFIIHL